MTRITWTAKQKAVIAKQALAIFHTSSLSFNASLQEAMVVLPQALRRDVRSMSGTQVRELRELGEQLKASEGKQPNVLEQPVTPVTDYSATVVKMMAELDAKAALLELNFKQRMEALTALENRVTMAMDKLAKTSDKVSIMLKQIDDSNVELELIRDELSSQMTTVNQTLLEVVQAAKKPDDVNHIEGVTITTSKKKAERQRVMVIGLRNDQVEMIKQEYGKRFKLTFIDTEGVVRNLPTRASKMDHIITTKFIDHCLYDPISSLPGHVHVPGGMTRLRDQLNSF